MKKLLKRAVSVMLALVFLLQMGDFCIAYAVGELDRALNPTAQIELTVPARFQDGGNWFFIPQTDYAASELSSESIYIPIQRTGDLDM